MFFKFDGRSPLMMLLLLALLGGSGCQQQVVGTLQGRWVGVPDTAAARAERESQKYGDMAPTAEASSASVAPERVTDWESYDLSVSLDFVDHERVKIFISGGADAEGLEPVSGKWHILSTTPIGCTIEVETAGEVGAGEVRTGEVGTGGEQNENSAAVVRRKFELIFDEREGECVGFTLREVGADRQLGMLYFRRPEGK